MRFVFPRGTAVRCTSVGDVGYFAGEGRACAKHFKMKGIKKCL